MFPLLGRQHWLSCGEIHNSRFSVKWWNRGWRGSDVRASPSRGYTGYSDCGLPSWWRVCFPAVRPLRSAQTPGAVLNQSWRYHINSVQERVSQFHSVLVLRGQSVFQCQAERDNSWKEDSQRDCWLWGKPRRVQGVTHRPPDDHVPQECRWRRECHVDILPKRNHPLAFCTAHIFSILPTFVHCRRFCIRETQCLFIFVVCCTWI